MRKIKRDQVMTDQKRGAVGQPIEPFKGLAKRARRKNHSVAAVTGNAGQLMNAPTVAADLQINRQTPRAAPCAGTCKGTLRGGWVTGYRQSDAPSEDGCGGPAQRGQAATAPHPQPRHAGGLRTLCQQALPRGCRASTRAQSWRAKPTPSPCTEHREAGAPVISLRHVLSQR